MTEQETQERVSATLKASLEIISDVIGEMRSVNPNLTPLRREIMVKWHDKLAFGYSMINECYSKTLESEESNKKQEYTANEKKEMFKKKVK